jgi:hypothetical protein
MYFIYPLVNLPDINTSREYIIRILFIPWLIYQTLTLPGSMSYVFYLSLG